MGRLPRCMKAEPRSSGGSMAGRGREMNRGIVAFLSLYLLVAAWLSYVNMATILKVDSYELVGTNRMVVLDCRTREDCGCSWVLVLTNGQRVVIMQTGRVRVFRKWFPGMEYRECAR